ncbi:MAG: hypothetical protein KJ799_02630 [Bacteroidetes bacterium]|nr:hypothetical protein [Bacteroidota bacterium]
MKILVTSGAGFTGSNLVQKLKFYKDGLAKCEKSNKTYQLLEGIVRKV